MIEDYFNTKVIWKQSSDINIYNEPIYIEKEIDVFKQDTIRLTRNSDGVEVTSTAIVFMKDKPTYIDLLDNRPILTINSLNLLDGIDGYEVLI